MEPTDDVTALRAELADMRNELQVLTEALDAEHEMRRDAESEIEQMREDARTVAERRRRLAMIELGHPVVMRRAAR